MHAGEVLRDSSNKGGDQLKVIQLMLESVFLQVSFCFLIMLPQYSSKKRKFLTEYIPRDMLTEYIPRKQILF